MEDAPASPSVALALCLRAITTYRNALSAHIGDSLTARFGDAVLPEVRATLGEPRWTEMRRSAERNVGLGRRTTGNPLLALDLGDFEWLINKYFYALHPATPAGAGPSLIRFLTRRVGLIREERNHLVHDQESAQVQPAEVLGVINVARQVLLAFGLSDSAREIDDLIGELLRKQPEGVGQRASETSGALARQPTVDDFTRLHVAAEDMDAFLRPLMQFFQEIADDMAAQDREEWIVVPPGQTLMDYAQGWNKAPENVVFAIQDWLVNGWGGGSTITRFMQGLDQPPPNEEPPRSA